MGHRKVIKVCILLCLKETFLKSGKWSKFSKKKKKNECDTFELMITGKLVLADSHKLPFLLLLKKVSHQKMCILLLVDYEVAIYKSNNKQ